MAIKTGQRTSKDQVTTSKSSKPKAAAKQKAASKKAVAKKKTAARPKAEISPAAAVAAARVSSGDEFLATGMSPAGKRFKVKSVKDDIAILGEVVEKKAEAEELPVPVENLQDSESWVAV
jgi:hypothetical protein